MTSTEIALLDGTGTTPDPSSLQPPSEQHIENDSGGSQRSNEDTALEGTDDDTSPPASGPPADDSDASAAHDGSPQSGEAKGDENRTEILAEGESITPYALDKFVDVDANWAKNFISIRTDNGTHQIRHNGEITKVAHDDQTVYMFNPGAKTIRAMTVLDLKSVSKSVGLVPFGEIDLKGEFPNCDLADMSVLQEELSVFLAVSCAPKVQQDGDLPPVAEAKIFLMSRTARHALALTKVSPEEAAAAVAEDDGSSPTALLTLRSEPFEIMGHGPIAIVRDQSTMGVALLSLDRTNHTVHKYQMTEPLHPVLRAAYAIPAAVAEGAIALDTIGVPKGNFSVRSKDGAAVFSLARLDMQRILTRAGTLTALKSEINGNAWGKQLAAVGLLSDLVQKLDDMVEAGLADPEKLVQDPDLRAFLEGNDPSEVIRFARESGWFTKKELDELADTYIIKGSRGERWFWTISAVGTLYGTSALLGKHQRLAMASSYLLGRLGGLLRYLLKNSGLSSETLERMATLPDRFAFKFKKRGLRNMEYQRHQESLIRGLSRNIGLYADKSQRQLYRNGQFQALWDYAKNVSHWADIKALSRRIQVRNILADTNRLRAEAAAMDDPIGEKALQIAADGLKESAWYKRFVVKAGDFIWDNTLKLPFMKTARPLEMVRKSILKDAEQLEIYEESLEVGDKLRRLLTRLHGFDAELGTRLQQKGISTVRVRRELDKVKKEIGDREALSTYFSEIMADVRQFTALGDDGLSLGFHARLATQLKDESWNLVSRAYAQMMRGEELAAVMKDWKTTGHVPKWIDLWAHYIVRPYVRFFVPERFYEAHADKAWVRGLNMVRLDRIRASGKLHKIEITGHDAQQAAIAGFMDVTVDGVTRLVSRQKVTDKNERTFGSGPNYIFNVIPWGGKTYGVHFDLVNGILLNAESWATAGPLTYAGMANTTAGTILQRFFNAQVKGLPLMLYGMLETFPYYWTMNEYVKWNYRSIHKNDFKENDYEEFKRNLGNRSSDLWSTFRYPGGILTRQMYGRIITGPYLRPLYLMSGQFQALGGVVMRNEVFSKIVSGFILPPTTIWFPEQWSADMFGIRHPTMIKILKSLKIDGIFDKVDAEGFTDLSTWTEHEKAVFAQIYTLLAIEHHATTHPFPEKNDAEGIEQWYADFLVEREARKEDPNATKPAPDGSTLVRMTAPKGQGAGAVFPYAEQAETLDRMLTDISKTAAALPLTSADPDRGRTMAVEFVPQSAEDSSADGGAKVTGPAGERPIGSANVSELERLVQDIVAVSGSVDRIVTQLSAENAANTAYHNVRFWIGVADSVALTQVLFTRMYQARLDRLNTEELEKGFRGVVQALARAKIMDPARKILGWGILASLPANSWLGDGAEAHALAAREVRDAFQQLQELLLGTLQQLSIEIATRSYGQSDVRQVVKELDESIAGVQQTQTTILHHLDESQTESRKINNGAWYRLSKVYSEFGPIQIALSGAYLIFQNRLAWATKGFIPLRPASMANFFRFFMRVGVIATLATWQFQTTVESRIAMTTEDFMVLYHGYVSSRIQLEALKMLRENLKSGTPLPANMKDVLEAAVSNDSVMKDLTKHREVLIGMITADQGGKK